MMRRNHSTQEAIRVNDGRVDLDGDLRVPANPAGLVLFAHGSGSSRFSRRNRAVASALETDGFATLLMDLLTPSEETIDELTREHRFDIALLGRRVVSAIDWTRTRTDLSLLPVSVFGASTGAAAALVAAAERPDAVRAVVSRGGRPDLAGADVLARVQAPTLLIVGGHDEVVIDLNREAQARMRAPVELKIIPGATHLFEEPGALDQVAALASEWCRRHAAVQPS